ncbi:hypothetical protein HK103_003836 [Boothiomyces macroporosus]|uniref:Uncharacterized protein n=1 Tax=Boothiomyces macroporosus TaxID=261099 RepID=A0AAD5UR25_9FUNG|nr:hypothetical protein HK103_003836 [Boothiomyces macroporosus]
MKREVDEVQDLQDTINKLKVRSESSAKRQALRNIKPSSFYAPAAGYSALTIEDNDEDLSDSTFEPSTQESTESTEDIETPEEEELETTILGTVEACTPVFFNTTALYEGDSDGASDYHGSDDGEGPDESPPVQYFNKTEKWLQRAASMLSSPNPLDQRFYGLPSNLVYWTTFMYKYKREENRWVKKGPVILYFNQQTQIPRLMGNYLYGTKANCLDMQIFETLIHYLRCANNLMCFSTFRRNAVKKAEIVSEKVALELIFPNAPLDHSLPVFKCTPRIYSAQEEDATVFALKFISPQGTFY